MKEGFMKIFKKILLFTFMILTISIISCSDKGAIHTENFKTPAVNNLPQGNLDIGSYRDGTLYAAGWSADLEDGVSVKRVMVYVDNKLVGQAKLGLERPDVGTFFKNPNWVKSGWEIRAKIPLNKAKHTLYAVVYDKMEAFTKYPEIEFIIE
jgi:hypothetical protein